MIMSNLSANSNSTREMEIKEAFKSAKTVQETLNAFKELEKCFKESELGEECFIVAEKFFRENNDDNINQVLCFGKRALTILTISDLISDIGKAETIFLIARVSSLLGSAYFRLKNAEDCLFYLNLAVENLKMLRENFCTVVTELAVQKDFCSLKSAMIRNGEAVDHAIKVLEISEKVMEEGCVQLGEINKIVVEMCFADYDHKRALPYCLKALEIYSKCLGPDSEEVAQVRRYLAHVYAESGQHEEAFECNQLAQGALRKKAPNSTDLLKAEIDAGNMMAELGRYQEAVDVLKGVLERKDIAEFEQARVSVNMGSSLCHLKQFDEARKCLKAAQKVLEKKETHPMMRIIGFADMAGAYEMMKDFETAILLTKKSLAEPELPLNQLSSLSARLCTLLSASGKVKEAITYMEGVVKKLKRSFGPKHYDVGCGYAHLGVAYASSGQMELAAKNLANAKDVMDISLGPHHMESLQISHDLSLTYSSLGRFQQALQIEEKVLEGLKGLPASELEFIHTVNKHLCTLRERVASASKSKR